MRWFLVLALSVLTMSAMANPVGVVRPCFDKPTTGQMMVTSWYSIHSSGTHTADGKRFDDRKLTAAHRTLPFGTKLRVTNPRTGVMVIVTVNDRGPFIRGRQLDLSRGAAEALGILQTGVASVYVEIC